MIKIKYMGKKPLRGDTVAGTGIVWCGYGDVQDVPDHAAPKLLQHADVWEMVDEYSQNAQSGDASSADAQALKPLASITANGEVIVLDGMTKESLHDLAKELGVKVHHLSGADKVTEALVAAFPV